MFERLSGVALPADTLSRVDSLPVCDSPDHRPHGSATEKQFYEHVARILAAVPTGAGEKSYSLSSSEFLDGCFEADIVIACEEGDGSGETKVFNIEIDGPSHRHPTKRRLCQRRDDYLREKLGVETVRIDINADIARGARLTDRRIAALTAEALAKLGIIRGGSFALSAKAKPFTPGAGW